MCGESWHAMKDSLTHRPSSQGWAPGVLPFLYKCFVCLLYVLGWRDGGRRVATYFFLFYYLYSWASMLVMELNYRCIICVVYYR